jgi:hypothetical protein
MDRGVSKYRLLRDKLAAAAAVSVFALSVVIALPASAASTTVLVTGDTAAGENQPGWLFSRDPSTATPYEFNTDASSIGVGSLYVNPIGANAADKFIAENFVLSLIADVESLSYDFKIGAGGTEADKVHFYMNVYANFGESNPLKFYDCRYNIVPMVGSTGGFTTVTFDPTQAYPVTTRSGAQASPYACPAVPADMDLLSPGSTMRVFAINVGDTSTNDLGLDGYLDNIVVSKGGDVTAYNLDPALSPADKSACKKDGWKTFNSPAFTNQGQCASWTNHND